MNSISCYSHNSTVFAPVSTSESADIINQQLGISITTSDVWRYAFYGHLTLSIYFQSRLKMRRVKTIKNSIVLVKNA